MTISLDAPLGLLTVADWEALPEDTDQRWELLEGVPVLVPKPTFDHNQAARWLANLLEAAAGAEVSVGTDSDVDLLLAPTEDPEQSERQTSWSSPPRPARICAASVVSRGPTRSLVANRLVDGRYEAAEPVRGVWHADAPFPVTVDLAALI